MKKLVLALVLALAVLGAGTLMSGVLPQPWVALAGRAAELLMRGNAH